MSSVFGSFQALTNSTVGGGYLFALAVVCLLQYVTFLTNRVRVQSLSRKFEQQVTGLTVEMHELNRDRDFQRMEIAIMRDVLSQTDYRRAILALLKRFIPNPDEACAAFLIVDSTSEAPPLVRGMNEETVRALVLSPELLQELQEHGAVYWPMPTPGTCPLLQAFSGCDRRKIRTLTAVACTDQQGILGVLITTNLLPIAASQSDQLTLCTRLLGSIAPTMRQTMELEQQAVHLQCTREMLELRQIADSKFDQPSRMVERYLTRLAQMLDAERVGLFLITQKRPLTLQPSARCGVQMQPGVLDTWCAHEETLARQVVEAGCLYSYDIAQLKQVGVTSLMGSAVTSPLYHDGTVIGALCVTRRISDRPTPSDRQLVSWSAETLSHVIHRLRSLQEIEKQAREDGLTGLSNRRTFDLQLAREIAALRDGSRLEFSLLLLDIDRFKSVNDKYGHLVGDEVLRATAGVLREQRARMRSDEPAHLARYGGEELAVLLPGVGVNGALRIAETLRLAIAAQTIVSQEAKLKVTVSIGVATCPLHAHSAPDLISAADAALYEAKSTGRNRVCAPTPVANELAGY